MISSSVIRSPYPAFEPTVYEDGSFTVTVAENVIKWLKEIGQITLCGQANMTLRFLFRLTSNWPDYRDFVVWIAPYIKTFLNTEEKHIHLYLNRKTDAQVKEFQRSLNAYFSDKMGKSIDFSKESVVASLLAGTHYEFLNTQGLIPPILQVLIDNHTHISVLTEGSKAIHDLDNLQVQDLGNLSPSTIALLLQNKGNILVRLGNQIFEVEKPQQPETFGSLLKSNNNQKKGWGSGYYRIKKVYHSPTRCQGCPHLYLTFRYYEDGIQKEIMIGSITRKPNLLSLIPPAKVFGKPSKLNHQNKGKILVQFKGQILEVKKPHSLHAWESLVTFNQHQRMGWGSGYYRIKKVYCSPKRCQGCPHLYLTFRYYEGDDQIDKMVGKILRRIPL